MKELDKGVKFDQDKNRIDLVPPSAIEAIGRALTHGAEKYEDRNWEKGMKYGRLYGAAMRHLLDWWAGSDEDDDSGLHPLDHAICDLAMLIEMRNIHPELDDRPTQDTFNADRVKKKWQQQENYSKSHLTRELNEYEFIEDIDGLGEKGSVLVLPSDARTWEYVVDGDLQQVIPEEDDRFKKLEKEYWVPNEQ